MAEHISDDDLERYAMGTVKDQGELAALEEHLLACGWCIARAVKTEGYIETMRAALRRLRAKRAKAKKVKQEPGELELKLLAFHEAGHAAVAFWLGHALHTYDLFLDRSRGRGGFNFPDWGTEPECSIMRLLGGSVAEFLSCENVPKRAIRFSSEYKAPRSDSSRIRELLRRLAGRDDKALQMTFQNQVLAILQEPRTWQAVSVIAEKLLQSGNVTGEGAQAIFERHNCATQFHPEGVSELVAKAKKGA